MGTFEGHWLPGLAFILIGTWHLYNVVTRYLTSRPGEYHGRVWFPAKLPGRWKYMELYLIIFGACCSIAAELVICQPTHQPFGPHWEIPIYNMAQFEHSSMSLFFLIFGLSTLITEAFEPLPWGVLHLVAAAAFSQELMLFHFHSGDHMGIEGQYHLLLQLPVAVGIITTIGEIGFPRTFLFPLVRAMSIIHQGLWFVQTAFSIWVPYFWAEHCHRTDNHINQCDSVKWEHRAKALANLQFNWHMAIVIVGTLVFFKVMKRRCKNLQQQYELVDGVEGVMLNAKEAYLREDIGGSSSRDGSGSGSSPKQQTHLEMEAFPSIKLGR